MPREGGTVRTVANPLCCTSRDTLPRLFTVPRGTPSPAEPFCTRTRRGGSLVVSTGCPTVTVALPCCGGRGTGKRLEDWSDAEPYTTRLQRPLAPTSNHSPERTPNCRSDTASIPMDRTRPRYSQTLDRTSTHHPRTDSSLRR